MLSVLITSTMKSDPSGPWALGNSFGMPVSAAAMRALGRTADGSRAGASPPSATGAVAAVAAFCGDTAVAAPATATPAMKLRRLTFGPDPFFPLPLRAIISSWGRARSMRDACKRFFAADQHSRRLNYHDPRPCHPDFGRFRCVIEAAASQRRPPAPASMGPGCAARIGEIVGIGDDGTPWLLRIEHLVEDAVPLAIGNRFLLGIEAQAHLL